MANMQNEDAIHSTENSTAEVKKSKTITKLAVALSPSDYCHYCQKRLYVTERIGPIKNLYYHKLCFKCVNCSRILDWKTYFTNPVNSDDMQIYCKSHVPRLGSSTLIDSMHMQSTMKLNQNREKVSFDSHHYSDLPPVLKVDDGLEKHNELNAYYSSFPALDDFTNDTSSNIEKAKEFTRTIMNDLPSGDLDDKNTLCHIIGSLLGNENEECLFYDSNDGINLSDASASLTELTVEDKPFVLTLNNSNGLEENSTEHTIQDEMQLINTINDAIQEKQSHPVMEDILERLSKAHEIEKESIEIIRVFYGSFNIVYTIKDLGKRFKKNIEKMGDNLKNQFQEFVRARIHPLLYRPSFDISYFDARGNKNFSDTPETFQIGSPERTQTYIPPYGWMRYGFKVLGKYSNDYWLHPFNDSRNWYRAYHGTGNAKPIDFKVSNENFDQQYASVDAVASIFKTEFRTARVAVHGPGVYCSPSPTFPESGYTTKIYMNTRKGKKTFKCMLQVAVNPDGVKFATEDIWVVSDPKNIRPYGILIKEVN